MTTAEILIKLQSLGNEKMRLHSKKNGAHDNQFGVKLGDIRKVADTIKSDHQLAKALWETGNVEARLLSTLIIVPKLLSTEELDSMVRSERFTQVIDWLYAYVIKEYPDREKLRESWLLSDDSMASRLGWSLTSGRIARNPEGLDIPAILDRIEKEMPKAAPEVQWTMNSALAQIGINHLTHRERAIKIGERLGIYRNYPVSKGCTSPFAPIWINEMVKRQG
ncbi:DNA alkylation repair protein [Mucilaginibacter rubeus]|uniref:DNA alkylation repair protein n=1 Tax=Mucilaginibacter rubeus TaxID=2027860 RepID=A0A5C1HSA0_9SPHI|nr:DNA alkylation repair protein [Mucilaginibacter rubeus]QEM08549.1 DNA alkylation repair protein [Mucilaginibacter rubeus]